MDVEKERLLDCFRPNGRVKKQQQLRKGEGKRSRESFVSRRNPGRKVNFDDGDEAFIPRPHPPDR